MLEKNQLPKSIRTVQVELRQNENTMVSDDSRKSKCTQNVWKHVYLPWLPCPLTR